MPFDPQCILVTGATSEGIGRALALAMLDLPHKPKVIVTGRRQDKLDELCSTSKDGRLVGKRLDQTASRGELKSWVQELVREHPELDMVILNAGIQHQADFRKPEEIDLELVRPDSALHGLRADSSSVTSRAARDGDIHKLHFHPCSRNLCAAPLPRARKVRGTGTTTGDRDIRAGRRAQGGRPKVGPPWSSSCRSC